MKIIVYPFKQKLLKVIKLKIDVYKTIIIIIITMQKTSNNLYFKPYLLNVFN